MKDSNTHRPSIDRYHKGIVDYLNALLDKEESLIIESRGDYQGLSSWPREQREWRKTELEKLSTLAKLLGIKEKEHNSMLTARYLQLKKARAD